MNANNTYRVPKRGTKYNAWMIAAIATVAWAVPQQAQAVYGVQLYAAVTGGPTNLFEEYDGVTAQALAASNGSYSVSTGADIADGSASIVASSTQNAYGAALWQDTLTIDLSALAIDDVVPVKVRVKVQGSYQTGSQPNFYLSVVGNHALSGYADSLSVSVGYRGSVTGANTIANPPILLEFNRFGDFTTFGPDVFEGTVDLRGGAVRTVDVTLSLSGDGPSNFQAYVESVDAPYPYTSRSGVFLTAPRAQLTLSKPSVAGCLNVKGTVTLAKPAPAGGTLVSLSDTLTAASSISNVTVPEGTVSKSFTIETVPVSVIESGEFRASIGTYVTSEPLTVRPMGLLSTTLSPTTAVGGQPVVGTAKLECKAGPGPITVDLSSSAPSIANPVAPSSVIPQGLSSVTFDVTTSPVLVKTSATISGAANGTAKSKALTLTPAAALSPTSLKFGSVAVGTTSATQSVTLSNKGAVAVSVNGISLTGTAALWFAQTNNCPASLPAGQSCTVGVTFTPLAASKKSAKVTIATSATSVPLSVTVSGTGL